MDKVAELRAELKSLAEKVKAGDVDAMNRANTIMNEELPAAEKAAEDAKKFAATIAAIGEINGEKKSDGKNVEVKDAKSLGEFVANSVKDNGTLKKGQHFDFTTMEFKAAATQVRPATIQDWGTDFQLPMVEQLRRKLVVADLLGTETLSRDVNAISYLVESPTVEGGPNFVAEGAAKPQISFGDPTPVIEYLHKLAVFHRESDEIIEDYAWLASNINNRALYQLLLKEEDELLNGNAASASALGIQGIMNRSGVQTQAYVANTPVADLIFKGMTKVTQNSPFRPDAIVINPADYESLRLAKDSNNQYYGGGFFQGEYGQNGIMSDPPIWGLRTVVTPAMTAGTVLVGAFKQSASVFRKGGVRVEMTNSDADDFTKNLVTIRTEERLGLAVRYPAGFCRVSIASA